MDLFLRMNSATFLTSISDSGVYPQKVSLQGLLEAPRAEIKIVCENTLILSSVALEEMFDVLHFHQGYDWEWKFMTENLQMWGVEFEKCECLPGFKLEFWGINDPSFFGGGVWLILGTQILIISPLFLPPTQTLCKCNVLIYNFVYIRLTAPASVEVPVGIGSNAAGSRPPGTSFPPHPVLKFPKWIKQTRLCFNKSTNSSGSQYRMVSTRPNYKNCNIRSCGCSRSHQY